MNNKLDLIIEKDCSVCRRTIKELKDYISGGNNIELTVTEINESVFENIPIVPALLINGKLFGYGDVDLRKLTKRLNS